MLPNLRPRQAYYDKMKVCHPDIAGEEGEENQHSIMAIRVYAMQRTISVSLSLLAMISGLWTLTLKFEMLIVGHPCASAVDDADINFMRTFCYML